MFEPITEIPEHIRALPEEEQGPALVKAIHDRKAELTQFGRAARGMDAFIAWVDELAQAHKEREAILRGVAARGLNPPKADDTPLTVRWACAKPTDPPTRVLYEGKYSVVKQGVVPDFGDFLQIWQEKR